MEREGLGLRHDTKSLDRPRLLNPEQEKAIEEDLDGTPRDSGLERGNWNSKMVVRRILERFGVPYSSRSAIMLAHRFGFFGQKAVAHPAHKRHVEGTEGVHREGEVTATRWRAEGRTVVAVDMAMLRDSLISRKNIREPGS